MFNMNNWCADVPLIIKLIYLYFSVGSFSVGGRLSESEAGLPPHHQCLDNIRPRTENKCFNAG